MILAYLVLALLLIVAGLQGIVYYEYSKNKVPSKTMEWSIFISLITLAIALSLVLVMIVAKKL